MSVVYKPLSNTLQWAKLSKDKTRTVGSPIDITEETLKAVALYLADNEHRVIVKFDKVEVLIKLFKGTGE